MVRDATTFRDARAHEHWSQSTNIGVKARTLESKHEHWSQSTNIGAKARTLESKHEH